MQQEIRIILTGETNAEQSKSEITRKVQEILNTSTIHRDIIVKVDRVEEEAEIYNVESNDNLETIVTDLKYQIVNELVQEGLLKDCTDTDESDEVDAENIIQEILTKGLKVSNKLFCLLDVEYVQTPSEVSDEKFLELANEHGTVYTENEFQDRFNAEEVGEAVNVLRVINL